MAKDKNPDLMRTFAGMERPPITSSTEAPERAGRIDTVAMVEAWQINVATQRQIIQALARAEDDNAATRKSNDRTRHAMYGAAFILVASMLWIHTMAAGLTAGNAEIVRLAKIGGERLTAVERTLKQVANAVIATNEAGALAADAMDAAPVATVRPRRASREEVAAIAAAAETAAEKRREAREMRIVARAHAVKAQVSLAAGAAEKAHAQVRLRKVEAEARDAHLDPAAF